MSRYSQVIMSSERELINYTALELEIMRLKKENVLNEINMLNLANRCVTYPNQGTIANQVVEAFKHRNTINIMVLAETQSGKTGSMCATIKRYLEDYENMLSIANICIITGYSSVEWKEQTKHRLPDCLANRVFHRSDLIEMFTYEILQKSNVLIIMDGIQIVSMKEQSISQIV